LLTALFPDGEDKHPCLKEESAQAWTLAELANAYSLSGEPHRAVPLVEMHNDLREKQNDKKNLAAGLGNVAQQQLGIGALGDAERNLRRAIELDIEIESKYDEGADRLELGRTLAYRGVWAEAEQELDLGLNLFEKEQNIQPQGVIWAYRSLRSLLMARETEKIKSKRNYCQEATQHAIRALKLADETARTRHPHERDYVRAHWLLGAAHRASNDLVEAEKHLSESLRRCRAINLVDHEADILLEVAKLRHSQSSQDESKEALRLAQEALIITERSGYVLQGADVNLFLAELALEGILTSDEVTSEELAREYAQKALKLAHCDDGPPYHYKVAYEEAERLLEKLSEK